MCCQYNKIHFYKGKMKKKSEKQLYKSLITTELMWIKKTFFFSFNHIFVSFKHFDK